MLTFHPRQSCADNPWIALLGAIVLVLLAWGALHAQASQSLPAGFTPKPPPTCTIEKCVGEPGPPGPQGPPGPPAPPLPPPPAVGRFDTLTPLLKGAQQVPVPHWQYAGTHNLLFFTPATGQVIYVDTVRNTTPGLWYLAPCYRVAPWALPRPYTSVEVLRADAAGLELSFIDNTRGYWWIHRWDFNTDPTSDGCIPIPGLADGGGGGTYPRPYGQE